MFLNDVLSILSFFLSEISKKNNSKFDRSLGFLIIFFNWNNYILIAHMNIKFALKNITNVLILKTNKKSMYYRNILTFIISFFIAFKY